MCVKQLHTMRHACVTLPAPYMHTLARIVTPYAFLDPAIPNVLSMVLLPPADATTARPGISFNSRFSAALDTTPSASSNLDLATEGSTIDLLLRASSATAMGLMQQSTPGGGVGTSAAGHGGGGSVGRDAAGAGGGFGGRVRWLRGTPRSGWGWVKRQGLRVMPCWFRKQLAEGERESSRLRESSPDGSLCKKWSCRQSFCMHFLAKLLHIHFLCLLF